MRTNIIRSQINTGSREYRENYNANIKLAEQLRERQDAIRTRGDSMRAKFSAAGKLLPRERIELLLDTDTPFLELSTLAAYQMYDDESPGASQITGIGQVSGIDCMISVNDSTAKGGAIYPLTVSKMLRAQTIALENRLPCIYLVESAGANLYYQAQLFAELGGRVFANQARMSAQGIPQISLVFGNSTAGGAYIPGLSDYVVMVRQHAKVFLGGPPLVKMATGEEVDEETLGGGDMHSRVSGLCDYLAHNDADAVRIGRDIVRQLGERNYCLDRKQAQPPAYAADEILGIVPANLQTPFDMREIIARIVDASRFLEFKANFGSTLVAGTAHIQGFPVGILANNGVLFPESAMKAAQFIQLCNQIRTPLLYLQNISGFMVGKDYEQAGIVKHGAKMVNAVATSTVPQFTIIMGGSYGAGNYGMCGRAYDPRLLFTWPNSRIGVMGAEQAAGVLALLHEEAARRKNKTVSAEQLAAITKPVKEQFWQQSDPYYATARLWDDGIIDPRDTRMALTVGLSICYHHDFVSEGAPHYGVFRM